MRRAPQDRVARFVDDLVERRRPGRFHATEEEFAALAGAVELASLHPGASLPDPEFVQRLERSLRRDLNPWVREPGSSRTMSRRALLQTGGTAAAAAVVGAIADHSLLNPGPAASSSSTMVPDGGRWRPVAALSELPAGTAMPFSTGTISGVLVNEHGTVRAVSAVCTHMGCILEANLAAASLDCPCHRTVFGWDGTVLSSQLPQRPANLPMIESRVSKDQIEVFVV